MPFPDEGDALGTGPGDPLSVRPHLSDDPSPSSTAPGTDGSLQGTDTDEGPAAFDQRYRKDFDGLMYLGSLVHSFEWLGHKFVIRTLTADEYLMVGLLTKDYQGTVGEARAFAIAMASLCTESIDGRTLPTPVVATPGNDMAWAVQRFNFVKARWFLYTVDIVYNEYLALEKRAKEVLDAMGEASGWEPSIRGSVENSGSRADEDFSASPV